MRPKVTISMYNDMPAGQYGLAQFWSGDAINMPYYLPKKTDPGVLSYWAPQHGRGEVDNDLVVCLGQGEQPGRRPLLHERDPRRDRRRPELRLHRVPAAAEAVHAGRAGQGGFRSRRTSLPRSSSEDDFATGQPLLELPITADTEYHQIWQEFKAGG